MAISAAWDNEAKTVIRYRYLGRWTWDEFYKALSQANDLMDSVKHKVDVIVDLRESGLLPENALSRGRSIGTSTHPNLGITMVVGANSFMQGMYNIFSKVYGKAAQNLKVSFVPSLDEAHKQLTSRQVPS